jgi:hypothetical protein
MKRRPQGIFHREMRHRFATIGDGGTSWRTFAGCDAQNTASSTLEHRGGAKVTKSFVVSWFGKSHQFGIPKDIAGGARKHGKSKTGTRRCERLCGGSTLAYLRALEADLDVVDLLDPAFDEAGGDIDPLGHLDPVDVSRRASSTFTCAMPDISCRITTGIILFSMNAIILSKSSRFPKA